MHIHNHMFERFFLFISIRIEFILVGNLRWHGTECRNFLQKFQPWDISEFMCVEEDKQSFPPSVLHRPVMLHEQQVKKI